MSRWRRQQKRRAQPAKVSMKVAQVTAAQRKQEELNQLMLVERAWRQFNAYVLAHPVKARRLAKQFGRNDEGVVRMLNSGEISETS